MPVRSELGNTIRYALLRRQTSKETHGTPIALHTISLVSGTVSTTLVAMYIVSARHPTRLILVKLSCDLPAPFLASALRAAP